MLTRCEKQRDLISMGHFIPFCPDCQSDLTFVASWTCRDLWGYREVRTYECASHGPVFMTSELAADARSAPSTDTLQDDGDGDRDALIREPRKPTPTLNVDAIELPEPD